jgi:hypothetical protein
VDTIKDFCLEVAKEFKRQSSKKVNIIKTKRRKNDLVK